jgi:hypothetical protein
MSRALVASSLPESTRFSTFDRRRDRAQRIAQLVTEHGKELVLGLVGGLGLQARRTLQLDQRRALALRLLFIGDVDADAGELPRPFRRVVHHQHAAGQPACLAVGRRDAVLQRLALAARREQLAQRPLDARAVFGVDVTHPLGERAVLGPGIDAEQLGLTGRPAQLVVIER